MLEIMIFAVGLISGMYIVTQIEKSIDKNIDCNSCNCKKKWSLIILNEF